MHLSAIKKIFSKENSVAKSSLVRSGPFKGFDRPHQVDSSNAAYVTGTLIDTFLITHPHLDHISGFIVNTSGLPPGTDHPKRLAGLPNTIKAFKDHIFNGVIWPNLTDENDGVGLITYMRLLDASKSVQEESKGYVEICEGLSVKAYSVSHGRCSSSGYHDGGLVSPTLEAPPLHGLRFHRRSVGTASSSFLSVCF